jgi:hypothetical protein
MSDMIDGYDTFLRNKLAELGMLDKPISLMGFVAIWELYRKEKNIECLSNEDINFILNHSRLHFSDVEEVKYTEN